MKPGFSTYSHYRIRLQGSKRGVHQDTGSEHTNSSAGLVRAGTRGRGARLPLTRERSVSSSHLALPAPVSTTVYERNVDVMWTLDTQLRSEGFRTYTLNTKMSTSVSLLILLIFLEDNQPNQGDFSRSQKISLVRGPQAQWPR